MLLELFKIIYFSQNTSIILEEPENQGSVSTEDSESITKVRSGESISINIERCPSRERNSELQYTLY